MSAPSYPSCFKVTDDGRGAVFSKVDAVAKQIKFGFEVDCQRGFIEFIFRICPDGLPRSSVDQLDIPTRPPSEEIASTGN